jgi:Na+-driven multidrug efflux pump
MITGASYFVLPYMVTAEYLGASQFIMWVSLGYAFRGMYTMVFPYLVHVARTSFLGVITAAVALLNLPLNYILIKGNGVVGAAQATLICFIVSFVCVWWYANRVCPMPWRFWRQDTPSAG